MLRPLPPMPASIAALPIDYRGYPIPFFVAEVQCECRKGTQVQDFSAPPCKLCNGTGKYRDFRVADAMKQVQCIKESLCWVCGQALLMTRAFVIGPMCTVNRVSSDAAAHYGCAEWSLRACPFLLLPKSKRREANLPEEAVGGAGEMVLRNPGVMFLWLTRTFELIQQNDGLLFHIGKPSEVIAYTEGRKATEEEVRAAFDAGMEVLREMADDGDSARFALANAEYDARKLLGIM